MVHVTEKQDDEAFTPANFSKLRILKNAFILCLVFFMTFTAYDCLSMLQSTMNHKHGIGVICQATVYGSYCLSALLLPKYFIKKLGCKITLVLSMSLYLPYIASNLYPHWSFMVPTAVLNGLSASLLWGAQCQYLNEIARQYATLTTNGKKENKQQESKQENMNIVNDRVSSYPEIKFVITDYSKYEKQNITDDEKKITSHTSVSDSSANDSECCDNQNVTTVVNEDIYEKAADSNQKSNPSRASHTEFIESNRSRHSFDGSTKKAIQETASRKHIESVTARFFGIHGFAYLSTKMWSNAMSYFVLQIDAVQPNVTLNSSCVCGADFCNEKSDCFKHSLQEPTMHDRYLLIGICISLGVVSIIIMAFFLDTLHDRNHKMTFSLNFLLATGRQLKKLNQILLTPISFYIGMVQGFYAGDFNLSFVGCAWGTLHVSLVSACYGAACAFSSPVSGWMVKLTGRVPIISFAVLVIAADQIMMLYWKPNTENPGMFFVLAVLWGTSLGILFSQIKAMYGFLFKDNQEAAFGAYHVWYSLGFCFSFALSNHLCTYVKIYALLSVLVVSFLGYLSVETLLRFKINKSVH